MERKAADIPSDYIRIEETDANGALTCFGCGTRSGIMVLYGTRAGDRDIISCCLDCSPTETMSRSCRAQASEMTSIIQHLVCGRCDICPLGTGAQQGIICASHVVPSLHGVNTCWHSWCPRHRDDRGLAIAAQRIATRKLRRTLYPMDHEI